MKTHTAQQAEKLINELPKEVREAVESMQRAARVRRVYTAAQPRVRYEHAY